MFKKENNKFCPLLKAPMVSLMTSANAPSTSLTSHMIVFQVMFKPFIYWMVLALGC